MPVVRSFFCVGFLLVLLKNNFAQSLQHPTFVQSEVSIGTLVKNYPVFPQHRLAFLNTISVGSKLYGSRAWHAYYNFPIAAFDLTYGALGNKNVLGNIASLRYRLEFPFKLTENCYAEATPAFGLAYFNKPYHAITNKENTVIGSALTFCATAQMRLRYYFNPFWSISLGAGVYHCSNSHYQLPNLGINLPVGELGLRYHIQPALLQLGTKSLEQDQIFRFQMRVSLGQNEQGASTFPVNGPRYPLYLAALYVTRYVTPVNKMHAGIEAWYNTGSYDFITSQQFYRNNEHFKSTSWQIVIGNEFLMGHFSTLVNGGVYVYNPLYRDRLKREGDDNFKKQLKGWITARLGFQYYIKDATIYHRNNFYAGVYIKTNLGQADFLETGIGYAF
jgi:hypothetical protein